MKKMRKSNKEGWVCKKKKKSPDPPGYEVFFWVGFHHSSIIQCFSESAISTDKLFSCSLLHSFNGYWFLQTNTLCVWPEYKTYLVGATCSLNFNFAHNRTSLTACVHCNNGTQQQVKSLMHRSTSDHDPSFLPDNPLRERLLLPKPSVRGNAASDSTEGVNLLFPLLLSLSPPRISYGRRRSLAHFLSFSRGQTGGTPVGFTLWEKKKKNHFFTFLFFTSFFPSFHPYLAKVKEIFIGTRFPIWHRRLWSLVSRRIVMQKLNLRTSWEGPSLNLCCFVHPHFVLFRKMSEQGVLWIKHHLSFTLQGFTSEWTLKSDILVTHLWLTLPATLEICSFAETPTVGIDNAARRSHTSSCFWSSQLFGRGEFGL